MSFLESLLGSDALQKKLLNSVAQKAKEKGITLVVIDMTGNEIKTNMVDTELHLLDQEGRRTGRQIVNMSNESIIVKRTSHEFYMKFYEENKNKY